MSLDESERASCDDVLAEVWLFLDNECDKQRRETLQQHLDECGSCLEEYGIEEHLKDLLQRKCGGEHAPTEFRERLRASIRDRVLEQVDVTMEHGPDGTSIEVRSKPTMSTE